MSRDVSGVYSKAVGTTATANTTIASAQFNSTIDDIVTDLNAARPITAGGTGATSAAGARTAFGVALAQTSTSDTTASSGLIVGAFGIGGVGVSAAGDLDLAIYGGIYQVASTTTNTPDTTGPSGSSCIVTRYGADDIQQIFVYRGTTSDDVRLYVRQRRAGTWGAWTAPAVRGSNSNGTYTKFMDGTMICTQNITNLSLAINNAFFGGFRSGGQEWTFPVAFAAIPDSVSVTVTGASAFGAGMFTPTASAVNWYVTNVTTESLADRSVRLSAIGRWR